MQHVEMNGSVVMPLHGLMVPEWIVWYKYQVERLITRRIEGRRNGCQGPMHRTKDEGAEGGTVEFRPGPGGIEL